MLKVTLIAVLILLLSGTTWLFLRVGEESNPKPVDVNGLLWETACKAMRDRLKAPATAIFPTNPTAIKDLPPDGSVNMTLVEGHVDAHNGFGALIRIRFKAIVMWSRGEFTGAVYVCGILRLVTTEGSPRIFNSI